MEERQVNFQGIFLMKIISEIKNLKIPYEIIHENITLAFTEIFHVHGEGINDDTAISDMFAAMRASARAYCDDFSYWHKENPAEFPYVLKVLISTDDDLKSCLIRKASCENS